MNHFANIINVVRQKFIMQFPCPNKIFEKKYLQWVRITLLT